MRVISGRARRGVILGPGSPSRALPTRRQGGRSPEPRTLTGRAAGAARRRALAPGSGGRGPSVTAVAGPLGNNTKFVAADKPIRRAMYALRDGLWRYQQDRPAKCGRCRCTDHVEVVVRGEVAHFHGVVRCGSVWACPVCGMQIRAERAAEIEALTAWWGSDRCFMFTATVRHGLGHDLKVVRRGVSDAWRSFLRARAVKKLLGSLGLQGKVRAFEVNHGWRSGWHPHLHVLVLIDAKVVPAAVESALGLQWRNAVRRVLGVQHVPDRAHGFCITSCRDGRYLSKLGLELSASNTKGGRRGNRTPMQIAADLVSRGRLADQKLWQVFCSDMKGAHQLEWDKGLRVRAGIEEATDQQIVDGDEGPEEVVARISGAIWDRACTIPGASLRILEAAEQGSSEAVYQVVWALFVKATC